MIIGTRPDSRDTDNDGIDDYTEIQQGLDPLNGRGFPTGVIASLSLFGEAKAVVVEGSTLAGEEQTAFLATGSHGLAIVDVGDFDNPIVLGQLDLPGDATDVAVDAVSERAVVAGNGGGLHIVDVSDPMLPRLVETVVDATSGHVELLDGVAYVPVGRFLDAYDLVTGERLQRLSLTNAAITGMAREGELLYVMGSDFVLRIVEVGGPSMQLRGSLTVSRTGGQVFVGGGIAYLVETSFQSRGGYATVDVSDPDNPALVSGSDVQSPFVAAKTDVVTNGSGVGLLIGSPASSLHVVDLVDVSDPASTNVAEDTFLTRIALPASPYDAVIGGGIGFIADGTAGLQIVNYLPFDNQGTAPTVTVETATADADPVTAGLQVHEGTTIPLDATVTDDVQVRNVELLVDGEVVRNDVSFPFDLRFAVPVLDEGEATRTVVVQVSRGCRRW